MGAVRSGLGLALCLRCKLLVKIETLSEEPTIVVRRMIVKPGESSDWNIDVCRRFTVIVSGDRLQIEFLDTGEALEVDVAPGLNGWDGPESRVHGATNLGTSEYHEIVTFYGAPNVEP